MKISGLGGVVGLRLDPDTEIADWFTIWFYDRDDESRVVTSEERIVWTRTPSAAFALTKYVDLPDLDIDPEPSSFDIAGSMWAIESGESGWESVALDSLNVLDDCVKTVSSIPPDAQKALNVVCRGLTLGDSLPSAVSDGGGQEVVFEAIYSSLGRVICHSSFEDS